MEEQEFYPFVGSEDFLTVMLQDFYTPHVLTPSFNPSKQAPEQGLFLFWFWWIDCCNGRDIVEDVSSIIESYRGELFQVVEESLFLMLLGAFNLRPIDEQVAFDPS